MAVVLKCERFSTGRCRSGPPQHTPVPASQMPADTTGPADGFVAALGRMGLLQAGETPRIHALAGGVSSDIVRADLARGTVCIKRALPKLKVAADWEAPVERNRYEVEWMRVAAAVVPAAVPAILGEDLARGCFAMAYLDPHDHPVWKTLLRDGSIDPGEAARVGTTLGQIHAATADRPDIATRF